MHYRKNALSQKDAFAFYLQLITRAAMLTNKGNQILNELKSELDAEIDTGIWHHIFKDFRNTLRRAISLLDKFFLLLGIYTSFGIFLTAMFVDDMAIDSLRQASNHEIVEMLSLYGFIILFLAVTCTFTLAFIRARGFSSSKSEMENRASAKVLTTKEQIELIEEVLLRHQLIEKKA